MTGISVTVLTSLKVSMLDFEQQDIYRIYSAFAWPFADLSDAIFCWLLGPEVKAIAHNNTGPSSTVSWNFLIARPRSKSLTYIFIIWRTGQTCVMDDGDD